MNKKIFVLLAIFCLFCVGPAASRLFAQGREFERLRVGTLPAETMYKTEEEAEEGPSLTSLTLPPKKAYISGEVTPLKEYILNVDDVVEVFVWQNADLSKDVIIGPDGKISYPLAGSIMAAGLTVNQLEQTIKEKLSKFVKSPEVSIMIKKFAQEKADKVIIFGEIGRPGIYSYRGSLNLIELVALAGDFKETARQERVSIVRGNLSDNPQVIKVNMRRVIKEGTPYTNIVLQPNDVIVVPKAEEDKKKIIILGEVNYPGIYSYKNGLNLIEAVALAGYFAPGARDDSVMIVRGNLTENPKVYRVNMQRVIRKGTSDMNMFLKPNDVIFVPKSFIADFNKFLANFGPSIDFTASVLDLRSTIRKLQGYQQ